MASITLYHIEVNIAVRADFRGSILPRSIRKMPEASLLIFFSPTIPLHPKTKHYKQTNQKQENKEKPYTEPPTFALFFLHSLHAFGVTTPRPRLLFDTCC